jgi:hypothetical protein
MPSSNLPDPDKIPNMELGERADTPTPPHQPIDPTSGYQPKEVPIDSSPEERDSHAEHESQPDSKPREWREGNDVLAPWEPFFLYPGVIAEIKIDDAHGDQALINFDDGGEGWVFLYSLCPLEFKIGQKVQVRHPHGNRYTEVEVVEVEGEEVQICYADGGTEWTTTTCIRVPCIENGPGAVAKRFAPWQGVPQNAPTPNSGIPSWVWTTGVVILLVFLRIGCRAMNH